MDFRNNHIYPDDSKRRIASQLERMSWGKWLEHWEIWNAIVAEMKPPTCGLFACDERVKVRGKWACGKITDRIV